MSQMTKNKKLLAITILSIAMIQMPFMALTPAIERMAQVFSDRSLSEIQTAVSLPSLISMFSAILSAVLITKGFISKKTAVISGLSMAILTAVAAIFLHTQFWTVCVYSVTLGLSIGFFIPTSMSIMFDSFNEEERQKIAGYQTSFTNIGGIVMSAVGGLLASLIWYGGYLAFFLMIPVVVLSVLALPKQKSARNAGASTATAQKTKIPTEVYYYAVLIFCFMMVYNVSGSNLSTHLAKNGIGNSATTGLAAAIQMAGGVASGLVFSKLSAKFRDNVIIFAFLALFAGYTILNVGHASLAAAFVGSFVLGSSMSLIIPQAMLSVSKYVEPSNSSAATTLVCCFAPGAGAFLSPVIFTNVTNMLGGDSTNFRFQFVAIIALLMGVAVTFGNIYLEKRASAGALLVED